MLRTLFRAKRLILPKELLAPFSTEVTSDLSGHENIIDFVDTIAETSESQNLSFASLLRHSKFMQLGDFKGHLVVGKIVQRIHDDVYIDFGLKFNAVCKVPSINAEYYRSGARVLIRLMDTELSERFLGSKKDLTLLEADAILVRLLSHVPGSVRKGAPKSPNTEDQKTPAEDTETTTTKAVENV